nr:unnamed protein product [Digitaria exilis]CAB3499747.1 unnamed protein product [Digitaria exilis]
MDETPQNTASTHRSTFVRGTHQLDIVGYSVRKELGVSNSVRSCAFEAGGHTWDLVCHFQRHGLEAISLELLLSPSITTRDVVAMAGLRISDPTGRSPAAIWRSHEAHTFYAHSSTTWKLSLPDAFREERYVHGDRLSIHCTVDVLEDSTTLMPPETRNRFISAPPPPSISHDLHRLLLVADDARWPPPDVTFVVEETVEIRAHKLVLSMRSPVFRALFHGSMKERFTRSVRIDDMAASTFRAMLRFIYTDELPIKPKGVASQEECRSKHLARRRVAMARDLLVAADRYGLERLRLMCENILSESLDATTVMATLTLVDGRYSCRQLEDSCIAFMASTFDDVVATPEYQELKGNSVSFIADIMERVALHKLAAGNCPSCSSSSSTSKANMKSASTYTSLVRGTHEFTVPNISTVLSALDVGHDLHSGSFQVGAYDWRIHLLKEREHLSAWLYLLTHPGTDKIDATLAFHVPDPDDKSWPPATMKKINVVYSKDNMAWGPQGLSLITLASAKAKSQHVGQDGSLTIRCDIQITNPESCGSSSTAVGGGGTIPVPPSNIAWHLEQLLASEQGSDIKFLLEGTAVVHAHMLVLAARSPDLYDQAAASLAGGTDVDEHVRIDDMTEGVFKAVLHFIYTDQLPCSGALRDGDMAMAGEVLEVAGRYRLERLVVMCQNRLAESISAENALGMLKLAERLRCKELEDYCLDYIASSQHIATQVMKSFGSIVN